VSDAKEKLIISADEIAFASSEEPIGPGESEATPVGQLSWWGRAALIPLVLVLPLLCIAAVMVRLANRRGTPAVKAAWNSYLGTLLVISGLLSSFLIAGVLVRGTTPTWFSPRLASLDRYDAFPTFEGDRTLDAGEVFALFKPLLFVVAPVPRFGVLSNQYLQRASIGSAFLVATLSDGYVLATNRHVADAEEGWLSVRDANEVLLFSHEWDSAKARVIARHSDLDMALLWLDGAPKTANFHQQIAAFDQFAVGDRIYVLGHPERLFFSMSDGMISRVADSNTIQITAPISPGSSGGPVLDERGNLLGLVSSMLDRRFRPNAQNLNFAVRADALTSPEGWVVDPTAKKRYDAFLAAMRAEEKTAGTQADKGNHAND
jgi:S1-C subfamily serine protease